MVVSILRIATTMELNMTAAHYFVEVSGRPSEVDDDDVPGLYEFRLPADYHEDARATAILDAFHAKVAIGMLEDFEIVVMDSCGNFLVEADGIESYTHIGEAEFLGRRGPSPPPFPRDKCSDHTPP